LSRAWVSLAPAVLGIDIGKQIFHLVGFSAEGKVAFRRKIKRPPP